MICKRETANKDQAQDVHRTPFLIYFGLTCALIGAIIYKWAVALL